MILGVWAVPDGAATLRQGYTPATSRIASRPGP